MLADWPVNVERSGRIDPAGCAAYRDTAVPSVLSACLHACSVLVVLLVLPVERRLGALLGAVSGRPGFPDFRRPGGD